MSERAKRKEEEEEEEEEKNANRTNEFNLPNRYLKYAYTQIFEVTLLSLREKYA